MIDVYNVSHEDYYEDLFAANHPSGNPTSPFSSYTDLTSPEVNDDIFDPEEDIIENMLNLDKTKDLPPYHDNQLSGNPTPISEPETKSSSSSPTLISLEESDLIWKEFKAYLTIDKNGRLRIKGTSSSSGTISDNMLLCCVPDMAYGPHPIQHIPEKSALAVLIEAPWFLIAASVEARISFIMFEFSSCLLADSAINLVSDSFRLGLRSGYEVFTLFRW
ncbi:hypothetical protein Tco_1003629 [Tanacetum coccineum]|uniref:Uncharacterized protein n=1 Tax=Tanacetum coccineum TaxID=301880 RepID=A0ABQ5F9I9_9ASTR